MRLLCFALLGGVCLASSLAAAEPIVLSDGRGAALGFAETETGWRWLTLETPSGPAGGWRISDFDPDVAIGESTGTLAAGWTLGEASADKVSFEQESPLGVRVRRIYTFGAANTVRIATWVQSTAGKKLVAQIGFLDAQVEGESFRETGSAPVSFPLFGQSLYFGLEHVSGECSALGELSDRVQLAQRPRVTVDETWQQLATVVVGWPTSGPGLTGEARIREAFLQYLDTVRIKSDRIVLHTDTWWTVPLPLNEKNVLADIEALRKGFGERTGMFFDTYCVDLGWSNPQMFWQMHRDRFPNELRPINERLESLGAKMGLWVSPGSGYPDALSNSWLQGQGYEMTPLGEKDQVPCFALGGRYQREFKDRMVGYAQQYGLGHVIFDYMAQRCDVASHGHPVGPESRYAIDAGLADVLDALRAVSPNIVFEPMVCGYPPSPWWLMKTAFVLGPAGDDLPYGRGPCPDWLESLITARDVAYRAGQESWIMPTQALETFDIVVLSPGEFENMAVMAIGRGRWFLSTYFKSDLMKPEDWDFFAALVRWARENKEDLGNAWQFGGRPENREAYGFMFRNPTRDLYCIRNPWIEEASIVLPPSVVATGPRDVRMIYPRRAPLGRIEPGSSGLRVTLAPYETMFLESVPGAEEAPLPALPVKPDFAFEGTPPKLSARAESAAIGDISGFRWAWSGTMSVPADAAAELCVLVEGTREVSGAICKIQVGGRQLEIRQAGSAGQFGAATDPSPENWKWFMASLPPGDGVFQIDLSVATEEAKVGVFVRGTTPAPNEPAPEAGAVFPTYHADRSGWSRTMFPLQTYSAILPAQ